LAVKGRAAEATVQMRRLPDEAENVHSVSLSFRESTSTSIQLMLVVAGAKNKVDVRSALHLKDAAEARETTKEIHAQGAVMIQRAAKYDEDASDEDAERTRGMTVKVLGTLLSFLVQLGMCGPETRLYVSPGTISTHDIRPKRDASGNRKGLASLVAYYRRCSFVPTESGSSDTPSIMVTSVRCLAVPLRWLAAALTLD
jgi:hypothetical protein